VSLFPEAVALPDVLGDGGIVASVPPAEVVGDETGEASAASEFAVALGEPAGTGDCHGDTVGEQAFARHADGEVTFKCPRCGGSVKQEFYGPCARCVIELRQLTAPAPDPNYVAATLPNGLPTTNYIGPRVDRNEKEPV
jgi:hypothetical protein